MKIKIEKRTSTKTNKDYICAVAYTQASPSGVIISFDTNTILRLSGLPITALDNMKSSECYEINN